MSSQSVIVTPFSTPRPLSSKETPPSACTVIRPLLGFVTATSNAFRPAVDPPPRALALSITACRAYASSGTIFWLSHTIGSAIAAESRTAGRTIRGKLTPAARSATTSESPERRPNARSAPRSIAIGIVYGSSVGSVYRTTWRITAADSPRCK